MPSQYLNAIVDSFRIDVELLRDLLISQILFAQFNDLEIFLGELAQKLLQSVPVFLFAMIFKGIVFDDAFKFHLPHDIKRIGFFRIAAVIFSDLFDDRAFNAQIGIGREFDVLFSLKRKDGIVKSE